MVHAWQCQGRSKKSVEGWIQVFVGYLMKERKIKKGREFPGNWQLGYEKISSMIRLSKIILKLLFLFSRLYLWRMDTQDPVTSQEIPLSLWSHPKPLDIHSKLATTTHKAARKDPTWHWPIDVFDWVVGNNKWVRWRIYNFDSLCVLLGPKTWQNICIYLSLKSK